MQTDPVTSSEETAAEPTPEVGGEPPPDGSPSSALSLEVVVDTSAGETPSAAVDEPLERFKLEQSIYYVPEPGHGSIYVPASTIVTRSSHNLQKLIDQGARLRPLID